MGYIFFLLACAFFGVYLFVRYGKELKKTIPKEGI